MVWIAQHTLNAIDAAIVADNANSFKRFQGIVLPHMGDAYKEENDDFRTHLGASVIGAKCERSIFFGWRWATKKVPRGKKNEETNKAQSRMRRLWNRGHLEEGRMISMLLMIGCQVYQQDANGKQFRIYNLGGHFSGSGDGITIGVPDLPPGVPCLSEFKTHSDKSFEELKEDGVKIAKPEHYTQMQQYMHHMGILYAIYFAVNKNTEELHAEIIMYDNKNAEYFLERARNIIYTKEIPKRINGAGPAFFHCKYMCDDVNVCYHTEKPVVTCRSCQHGFAMPDGTWQCALKTQTLTKEDQIAACEHYKLDIAFK